MVKVREKSQFVRVNAGANLRKLMGRNYVNPTKHSILLPYFDELENEADKNLQSIINGMMTCALTENVVECCDYMNRFQLYLKHFGLRMSKETFLNLVRFFYEVLLRENQFYDVMESACKSFGAMMKLVKPRSFGWRDLTLEWKPLYDLFEKAFNDKLKIKSKISPHLSDVLDYFAVFYHPEEQARIWETLLQEMIFGSQIHMNYFMSVCRMFLSIQGMNEEDIKQYAVKTWINEIWDLYLKAEMNTSWTGKCVDYIAELCIYAPGAYDFSQHYDILFTKTMRSFNLTVRDGKISVGDGQESTSTPHLATICAYAIGGPHSALPHFIRLIEYISFNVHPLNSGDHTDQIESFLLSFLTWFRKRLKSERLSWRKRQCSTEYYLKDSDIDAVTKTITDVVFMLMFSNTQLINGIIYLLSAINREYVAPKLLDHLYSSLTAVSEPHRLTTIIEAFSIVAFEVIRQTDQEFRTPLKIVYDSKWLKFLENERKNWPTYQHGSEVSEIHTHSFTSLRAHAFYLIEIFVNQINVNDFDRTRLVLKTLEVLFSSFPLMEFASAIEFHKHELSEDDRIICLLSKRLPHLVDFAFEKILDVVSLLSVVPPKTSSGTAGESISNEMQKQIGDEEAVLISGIDQLVKIMFERVDDKIRKRLFDRLFHFLSTTEFASYLATEALSATVATAVWESGDAFRQFGEFISNKLKTLITDDVEKSMTPPSTVIFYVSLARTLFASTNKLILDNEKIFFEMIEKFLKCKNQVIHKCGTHGVVMLLQSLLCITADVDVTIEREQFTKPLNEWNPINYWAKCNHYKDITMKWYIPAKPEIECVQRIVNTFFFPYIAKLADEELDRDSFRRVINHVTMIMQTIDLFQHPKTMKPISDPYSAYCLPPPPSSLGTSCVLEYELKGPSGQNSRQIIIEMIEKIIPKTQDPTALTTVCTLAYECFGMQQTMLLHADIEAKLAEGNDTYSLLVDSMYCRVIKASQHTMKKLAILKHAQIEAYHYCQIRPPNDFDQRIIECLFELSLNDYSNVRKCAVSCLKKNRSQIRRCRHIMLPKVISILTAENITNKFRLIGAMELVDEFQWLLSKRLRLDIWDAVLRIKVVDELEICIIFEALCNQISGFCKNPIYRKYKRETHEEKNKKVAEVANRLKKPCKVWSPLMTEDALKKQTDAWFQHENLRHSLRAKLVDKLFENHIQNPKHHHTREKLARKMAYYAQREASDERTISLLLSQLNDEDYNSRIEARQWLAHWLKENKPITVREFIQTPKRVDHHVPLESGVREDNLWLMYDSENLPATVDKWNEMIFLEKEKGACRWPEKISVVRKRNAGEPLEAKPLTQLDKLVISWFSNSKNVAELVKLRLIEKEDHQSHNEHFCQIFKYVIRNYPYVSEPLELFKEHLKKLLKCKKLDQQLLASELFLGIVEGIKHRPFAEQEVFWKDITVCLDEFINLMIVEAKDAWCSVMFSILNPNCDLRRRWWLVESLIQGADRATSANEFQLAFRLTSIFFKRWRYAEIVKRLTEIAWSKLDSTITDSLRYAISRVFRSSALISETNQTATLINIPEKFITASLDSIIHKIIQNIPHLNLEKSAETARRRSDTATSSPTRRKQEKRGSVFVEKNSRTSLTYFRTLLELIIQYYDCSMRSWSPALVQLLPKLMEYANEENFELSEETYRDVDITQNSALITHDYMSGCWLGKEFLDDILKALQTTFTSHSESWRVRQAVVKFVQASVYSNMYAMCTKLRRDEVEKLIFEAIFDREISVRKEASYCLLLFIHCQYIHISEEKVNELANILNSKFESEANSHGAALALGAFVLAYPFSLPREILNALSILSSSTNQKALVKNTMTNIVREFRRQHRDNWEETKNVLGVDLVFHIQNATAPAYYA